MVYAYLREGSVAGPCLTQQRTPAPVPQSDPMAVISTHGHQPVAVGRESDGADGSLVEAHLGSPDFGCWPSWVDVRRLGSEEMRLVLEGRWPVPRYVRPDHTHLAHYIEVAGLQKTHRMLASIGTRTISHYNCSTSTITAVPALSLQYQHYHRSTSTITAVPALSLQY
jgi:hypothetical protein